MGSGADQFDVTTAGATTREVDIFAGERLQTFSVDMVAGSAPVHVRASYNTGNHGHVLVNGWIRAPATGGSEFALVWFGDLPITDEGVLQVAVRNDTGATQTVRFNWVKLTRREQRR